MKEWWENIKMYGQLLGYYPKATKSWLVMKDEKLEEASNSSKEVASI